MKTKSDDSVTAVLIGTDNQLFSSGLTKRELAAFMAMQGLLSNPIFIYIEQNGDITCRIDSTKYAVEQADALIKELNKE